MKKFLKNHFGFTLIEMITAFAVLGVASLAIGGFFVSSSRSYASSSSETGLQYEAQMALNQIEGKLIDATLGVNYNLYDGANNFVEQDTATEDDLQAKILYIFDYNKSAFNALLVKWDIESKELLYKEVPMDDYMSSNVASIPINGTWDLLAEGVKNFSIDLSKYMSTKTVDVTIELEKRNRSFETVGTITLRNNVLVNASSISDIYNNMSGTTATRIDGVILEANANVTKPSGTVQLSTTVKGVYPSQDIYQWLIAYYYDGINSNKAPTIGDNTVLGQGGFTAVPDSIAKVDSAKRLNVYAQPPEGAFHQTLYVQAVVKDENGDFVYSNVVAISVRNITGLSIWPTAKVKLAGNETLENESNEQYIDDQNIAKWPEASIINQESVTAEALHVYPSNKIDMNYRVEGQGQGNTGDNIAVVWTIEREEGVLATIDETTGVVSIDRNSKKGTITVTAHLGNEYEVSYDLEVSSPYAQNKPTITIDAPSTMNRGQAPYQCSVYLGGQSAFVSDYDWNVVVKTSSGQLVTGNPVEISSTGLLTVKDTLSFDYSYNVVVHATLKSDPDVGGNKTVVVPKVSMYLTTNSKFIPTVGGTIPAGKIICNVVGLTNYDIDWTVAKATNPTYYFTAYGNTNITGDTVKLNEGESTEREVKTPKIVIGADEPADLEYIRVKATLAGHSNYSSTMKLNLNSEYGGGSSTVTPPVDDDDTTVTPPVDDDDTPVIPPVEDDDDTPVIPPVEDDDDTPIVETLKNYFIITDDDDLNRNQDNNGNSGNGTTLRAQERYKDWRGRDKVRNATNVADWKIVAIDGVNIDTVPTGLELRNKTNSTAKLVVLNEFMLENCANDIHVTVAAYDNSGKRFEEDIEIIINAVSLTIEDGAASGGLYCSFKSMGFGQGYYEGQGSYSCSLQNISETKNITDMLSWTIYGSNFKNNEVSILVDKGKTSTVKVSNWQVGRGDYNNYSFSLRVTLENNGTSYLTDDIKINVTRRNW